MKRIKLGISKCLIGENVRYDGGHKLDRFIRDTLGQYVDFEPVCPEAECGLGIPREAMRLVGDPESPRLMTIETRRDLTDQMLPWARRRVRELTAENLCGFIFKCRSPSCGMERVKVFNEKGMPTNSAMGVFARIFKDHFPLLPVEEEGRLHDPGLRENFIEAIFTLKRWRELRQERATLGNLVGFHTRNKYLLLSHSRKNYRAMGKLVAQGKGYKPKALYSAYETLLLETLRLKTKIT